MVQDIPDDSGDRGAMASWSDRVRSRALDADLLARPVSARLEVPVAAFAARPEQESAR